MWKETRLRHATGMSVISIVCAQGYFVDFHGFSRAAAKS
jgi:hypothetical protein